MKRNRWRDREKHVRNNRKRTCNIQSYVQHHRYSTKRSEQGELQNLQNSHISQTEPPSTSADTSQSSLVPELPGFYYDPEKNRYFRLLPGHNNCNPLTKENIHQKQMESQRLRLLKEEERMIKKAPRSGLNTSIILYKKQLGFYNSVSYCRLIHELKVNCMQRRKLELVNLNFSGSGRNNFKLIAADTASERIFTVNDVNNGGCKYGIVNLSSLGKDSLSVEMYGNLYLTNRKVNSVCWASLSHLDSHIFCASWVMQKLWGVPTCFQRPCSKILPQENLLMGLRGSYFPLHSGICYLLSYLFKEISLDCCAASRFPQPGLVPGVTILKLQTALAQSPVLYNGCRSGEVFSIDVRQRNHKGQGWKAARLFHDSAVTSVNLLKSEQYLMVADMLGQVKLWDLRKLKCVKEYRGHKNEHTILPLHISEEEGLLTAVGQDCYTRIWSLQDAHLLRTIPSPYPSSTDSIPSVVFSSQLGGVQGVPGLLMAVSNSMYHMESHIETHKIDKIPVTSDTLFVADT